MDNKNIVIDVNNIASTKQLMDNGCTELLSMLNKYKEMFNETKNIYDTNSATIFRNMADMYIAYVERYINNDLKVYINQLDEIKNIYVSEISTIAKEVGGGTNG